MKIYVIGTGTMAKGIVKAFAAKMPVTMKSRTQASLDKAMASIAKGYGKLVEKGKMTQEQVDALLKNITTTTDYATFADADLVIEAAVEEMQLKKDVFTELDGICKPETIFATNSSSLSITEIAANAPLAVSAAKLCINTEWDMEAEDAIAFENRAFGLCFNTEDQKNGMQAFLTKGKCEFQGK